MAVPPPVMPTEHPFNMRGLWRLALWGSSAAAALTLVVLVQNSENGRQRMALMLGHDAPTRVAAAPATAVRNPEAENELRRQADALRILNADRERLVQRLAALERNVEDITGSVRQPQRRETAAQVPTTPAWLTPPMVIAPATTQAAAPTSRLGAKQQQAEMPPADTVAIKTEFGIDLGSAANVEDLRSLWNAAKLSHPAVLDALRPVVGLREEKGRPSELRLIAGPVANAGVAARLCATLAAAGKPCQPAVFDGQRLALH